jgi:hypothetical protein
MTCRTAGGCVDVPVAGAEKVIESAAISAQITVSVV